MALPLPGHTPGLVGLLAGLERSGEFLLASDAVSIGANLSGEAVPKNTWNADLLLKSLTEIRRIGARGATVVCGHDLEQWNRLKKGADAYD